MGERMHTHLACMYLTLPVQEQHDTRLMTESSSRQSRHWCDTASGPFWFCCFGWCGFVEPAVAAGSMLPAPPRIESASLALYCVSGRAPHGQAQRHCDGWRFSVSVPHAQPSFTPESDNGDQQCMIQWPISPRTSLKPNLDFSGELAANDISRRCINILSPNAPDTCPWKCLSASPVYCHISFAVRPAARLFSDELSL